MGAWFRWIKKLYEYLYENLEALKAGFPGLGTTYFVVAGTGLDTNSGLTPGKALLTLAAALAKCVDGHDDVIIARGSFTESITVTKSKVHLFGIMGKGPNQSYLTRISSDGTNPGALATRATILIQAIDVEIAYLQVMGNRDVGKHYPAIDADGCNSGTRANIHDVVIPMLTPSATEYCTGIHLAGDRHTVAHAIIENSDVGILIDELGLAPGYPAPGVTTYRIVLEDIKIRACNTGINVDAVSEATGRHGVMGKDIHIDGNSAFAVNRAILVGGLGGSPAFENVHMGGYGANQAATVTMGNGKFSNSTWAGLTGVSAALA